MKDSLGFWRHSGSVLRLLMFPRSDLMLLVRMFLYLVVAMRLGRMMIVGPAMMLRQGVWLKLVEGWVLL